MVRRDSLIEHASVIRALGKRVVGDIVEIGRRLTDAKARLGHGQWLPWLEREFGWKEQTARNFMQVHAMVGKSPKFGDLNINASALYLLARPSTADDIRDDVIARAANGQSISHEEVQRMIEQAREQDRRTSAAEWQQRVDRLKSEAEARERAMWQAAANRSD
ncbi:DUF3102 domain-containing protein [Bradyrhizobium cenepequi]